MSVKSKACVSQETKYSVIYCQNRLSTNRFWSLQEPDDCYYFHNAKSSFEVCESLHPQNTDHND
jgi:hypothetical protein